MTKDQIIVLVRAIVREELAALEREQTSLSTKRRATDAEAEYLRSMLARAPEHSNVASALGGMLRVLECSVTPEQLGQAISSAVVRTMRPEDLGPYLPPSDWRAS